MYLVEKWTNNLIKKSNNDKMLIPHLQHRLQLKED